MELVKDNSQASYQIQRYRTGFVTINHKEIPCPLIVTTTKLLDWDPLLATQGNPPVPNTNHTNLALLNANAFSVFAHLQPDVVIIGMGDKNSMLPIENFLPLIEAQIGFEIMTSLAACRTYSLLSLEGRNVALGLIC